MDQPKTLKQRVLLASLAYLATVITVCFLAWSAGFDFDKRGEASFNIAFWSIVGGTYLFWLVLSLTKK
jgi:hypothetical protein